MSTEIEPKVEIKKIGIEGIHTRVTTSKGIIVFDRMTEGSNSRSNHFFDIDYKNLVPKNTKEPEIILEETKEYCCGVTHTIKRHPDGRIYFDRIEDTKKMLESSKPF